jgi:hypothetical protein
MAKCEDKSLEIKIKKATATGASKDQAELALAGKLIEYVLKKQHFTCDGVCPEGDDCEAVVEFGDDLHFRPCWIRNKPPQKGHTIGWKCSFKGRVTIRCECAGGEPQIDD